MKGNIPEIAIVGRPNVGKSSLFNAIIRKRKTIVDETSGITRDRIYEKTMLDKNYPVYFIDTGGISKQEKHLFIEEITESAKRSIAEADLVLFVVDVVSMSHDDDEIAEFLRKNALSKTVLVVNKVDNDERELLANEYYSLGFHHVFFTSSAHMKGIIELSKGLLSILKERELYQDQPIVEEEQNESAEDGKMRITLLGRPNVGKSSLMNLMFGSERSIVSDIPGTTRDLIEEEVEYHGKKMILVDTAGIRRKAKIKEKIEYVSIKKSMSSMELSDIVILLIDSEESITDQDKKLLGLALDKYYKGLIIAVNKWDLIKNDVKKNDYIDRIRFLLRAAHYVPIVPVSVKEKFNLRELFNTVFEMYGKLTQKISTHDLTECLRENIKERPLYSKDGNFKVFYAVQIGYKPPHFKLVVNHKELLNEAYIKFLHNTIRSKFELDGIPLKIDIEERKRKKS